jgi:hypothetical protein
MIFITGLKYFRKLFLSLVLCIAVFSAIAQELLPDGKGRDVLIISCTQCHGLDYLGNVSLTTAQWENALYDMIGRGAIVEKNDLEILRNYLIDNYATDR